MQYHAISKYLKVCGLQKASFHFDRPTIPTVPCLAPLSQQAHFPHNQDLKCSWKADNARSIEIFPLSLPQLKRFFFAAPPIPQSPEISGPMRGKGGWAEGRSTFKCYSIRNLRNKGFSDFQTQKQTLSSFQKNCYSLL